jgi:cardiolipin synthase C
MSKKSQHLPSPINSLFYALSRLTFRGFIYSSMLFAVFTFVACHEVSDYEELNKKANCSLFDNADSISLSSELAPFENIMPHKTGVLVLEDGGNSMLARAWLTQHAEKSIDIQYFIFSTDNVGLIACDYLVRAADKGVKIRILVDDIMVEAKGSELLLMDSHPNISIRVYNPGTNVGKNISDKIKKLAFDFKGLNQRMHNKTFIVDNKVAITGGRNIADEYFDYDHAYNFRDRDVLLIGSISKQLTSSFELYWNSPYAVPANQLVFDAPVNVKDSLRYEKLHAYACNPENFWPSVRHKVNLIPQLFKALLKEDKVVWTDSVVFISDLPGKNEHKSIKTGGTTTDSLIALVQRAKYAIDIQSPYLITTDLGKKVLSAAVKRGVKIRVLTNSLASTDNTEAFSGYQRDREALLKKGIRIFEFKPDAKERYRIMTGELQKQLSYQPIFGLHAKSMVIDGHITVIGTFNLDPRSAHLNTECVTVIHSVKIAEGVLKGMEIEFQPDNAWETTLTFNPDKEAGIKKRMNAFVKKVVPKEIL